MVEGFNFYLLKDVKNNSFAAEELFPHDLFHGDNFFDLLSS